MLNSHLTVPSQTQLLFFWAHAISWPFIWLGDYVFPVLGCLVACRLPAQHPRFLPCDQKQPSLGAYGKICWIVNYTSTWILTLNFGTGAISAIFAWFILTFPARIVYVQTIVPLPAALWGVLYLANTFLAMYRGSYEGGECHLGGALVGAAFFLAWQNTISRE